MKTAQPRIHPPTDSHAPAASVPPLVVGTGFSVQKFIENFEVLAEARCGITRLRGLVLNLAIRGKLTSTHTEDNPAAELLDSARRDRESRLARGLARQMAELGPVREEEAPFSLPKTWTWTRIGSAMNLVNGRAFKPSDWSTSGLPIIRIQNLNSADAPFNYCSFEVDPKHLLRSGDFLISWSGTPGTSFGAFIWTGEPGVLNQHIFRGEVYGDAYDLRFLKAAINARLDEMIAQAHGAVGLQHITKGRLEALAIPVPPLAEQKRIVAKVDELMRLLDDLEAKQAKRRETQTRLRSAALSALTTADGPDRFAAAWMRVAEHFHILFDRPASGPALRSCLLDLAVRGHLAPQDPVDEPAGALLDSIAAERVRTVEPGKLRRDHAPSWALDDDLSVDLPGGWARTKLGDILSVPLRNGHSISPGASGEALRCLTLTAVTAGIFSEANTKFVQARREVVEDLWAEPGDIFIERGNTPELVGTARLYRGERSFALFPDLLIRARIASPITPDFVEIVLRSPQGHGYLRAAARGTAKTMPKIGQDVIAGMPIPIPPLAEQHRIVAKVHCLLKICDELESKLRRAEETAAGLVEAVVSEMVSA